MGFPPTPTPTHLYPQAIQIKLYQAFIFSIPILFSIILFLLFYLFYLKRRATSLSSPIQILPTISNQANDNVSSVYQIGLKKEIKDKLPIIFFDEELRTRESQCCVCLGEFEIKEQLLQIPTCKHVFHIECIHHWLRTNSTCPLCRSFVIPTTKLNSHMQTSTPETPLNNANSNTQIPSLEQQQQQQHLRDSIVIPIEESSSTQTCSIDSAGCPEVLISLENERGCSSQEDLSLNMET